MTFPMLLKSLAGPVAIVTHPFLLAQRPSPSSTYLCDEYNVATYFAVVASTSVVAPLVASQAAL